MREPSGRAWVDRYPTSKTTAGLVEPFQTHVERFITALEKAGAHVRINATARPRERAYLMRCAWDIAQGKVAPSEVEAHPGVDIDWTHNGDNAAAVAAAREMKRAYGLAYRPSLTSHHIPKPPSTQAKAIDMVITWPTAKPPGPEMKPRVTVTDGNGHGVSFSTDDEKALFAVGASYGVHKLESDEPHWSVDGR